MEKQQFTFRQKTAYAHWSAKQAFLFPCVGELITLIVALICIGLLFWFFEPEVIDLLNFTGPSASTKHFLACFAATIVTLFTSFATVYAGFFMAAFRERNDAGRRFFMKYEYRKR